MGVTGAEMDKFAESKGMDFASKEEAKDKAREQAEALYDQQYGDMDNYDPCVWPVSPTIHEMDADAI